MKTTIHWRTILIKIIGLVLVVFSIVKMSLNPGFFSFSLLMGIIFLVAGKVVILKIDDKELRFDRYYLNGTINRTEVIKLNDILGIEFKEGRTHLEDIFLIGSLPERDPDRIIIHRKHSEKNEYELHFYKSEISRIVDTLEKKIKTNANSA